MRDPSMRSTLSYNNKKKSLLKDLDYNRKSTVLYFHFKHYISEQVYARS